VLAAALLLTGAGLGSVSAHAASADVVDPTPSPTASASPLTSPGSELTETPVEATPEAEDAATDSAPVTDLQSTPQPVPADASPEAPSTTLSAMGSVGASSSTPPIGNLDGVARTQAPPGTPPTVSFFGWALDPDQPGGAVTVHYYVNGSWGGSLTTDVPRNDVGMLVPGAGPNQGFAHSFAATDGTYEVCVYAIDSSDADLNTRLGCGTVSVSTNRIPRGNFEGVFTSGGSVTLKGWAFDPDAPTAAVTVHYYVDYAWGGSVTTGVARPDVAAAHPGTGTNQGFTGTFTTTAGTHEVCVYAIDNSQVDRHSFLDCQEITVGANGLPVGNFEHVTVSGSSATLQGWAFDPDDPSAAVTVKYYTYGDRGLLDVGVLTTGIARPDVAAAFPGAGPNQGFTGTVTLGADVDSVVVVALDNQVDDDTRLGLRRVVR
jgi:hypothetical protein